MPLLWSSYPDLDNNLTNAAKKKIFKSSVDQYTKVSDIQSNIQPTQSQMNEYFLKITTFIKQLNQQLNALINSNRQLDISEKISLEFGSRITEFANEFNIKIYPVYNYFSPQQNELIKNDILRLETLTEEILFSNLGQAIDNFIENINEQLSNLALAVDSYSPLKINLRKGRQLLTDEELQGGYISGGSRNKGQKYPEIRFL